MNRTILFAEVPSFYASAELAADPGLAGRPLIVGGDPRKRGTVQAASPDARAAGVSPEMPMLEALRLCPRARVVRTRMGLYRETSRRLFACMRRSVPRLESFGLGAAYFDLTGVSSSADAVGEELRERVGTELGLPLQVGIASSKFLARLAAREAGERGMLQVAPGGETRFLAPLAAALLDGVGRKTAAALAELGAQTIGDVVALGAERLEEAFGTHGLRILALARGEDDEPVRAERHPQSLSREVTLGGELLDLSSLGEQLLDLARHLESELVRQGLAAARVGVKVRFADQGTQHRSRALQAPVRGAAEIQAAALGLLDRSQAGARAVRGLGLQLSRLSPADEADRQLALFPREQ